MWSAVATTPLWLALYEANSHIAEFSQSGVVATALHNGRLLGE
jgi:hypothetical protein